ncbi:MAG: FGGY-family carbohydrate kinase [bacterium]
MFAGIDLGTSGCRLIIMDVDETLVHESQIRYPSSHQQTPQLWWDSVSALLRSIPANLRQALQAISVDGTSSTLLLCDAKGKPSSPALMYYEACATTEAQHITPVAPTQSDAHGASSSLAKLLYLLKKQPLSSHPHYYALHQADWISAKLSATYGYSDENNALKLGYDPIKRRYPDWLIRLLDEHSIPSQLLPKVQPPASYLATIDKKLAQQFSLPQHLAVFSGTTDSIAAFLATGANQVGEAVSSLGTTLVLKLLNNQSIFVPELGIYSHRLWDQWLVGGASNSGGGVLQQFFDNERLAVLSTQICTDQPSDLDYYPLPSVGERFPIADPHKRPKLSPRPSSDVDFLYGLFSGIANIEATGYQCLQAYGAVKPRKIYTVGGGSHNPTWTKIRQNKLGIPVITIKQHEAAFGSAKLAKKGYDS